MNDSDIVGDVTKVGVTYTKRIVKPGDKIYVDDGLLGFTVVSANENAVECVVDNSGMLGENKGINLPGRLTDFLPAVSSKDFDDIRFGLQQRVDFLAVSCVRSEHDVMEVRCLLGDANIKVISKIENASGFGNADSILRLSDGILLDRGYLGVEIDIETVAISQKDLVKKCNAAGKPIMIANEMLESMRNNPRPTRAEAVDVANAVLDGADALILSSETAVGMYPVESLQMMKRICLEAENSIDYAELHLLATRSIRKPIQVSESIASSAVKCAMEVNAKLIIVVTESGKTARLVGKYRPPVPVFAFTCSQETARQLSICRNVVPYYVGNRITLNSIERQAMLYAMKLGLAREGDTLVFTSGQLSQFMEGSTTKIQVVVCCAS